MDAVTKVPSPINEPVRQHAPGSPDRAALESKIKEMAGEQTELTLTIGGQQRMGAGDRVNVV
ncbi:MAG TPA: 1-pyrroline-5-carboxylate dehydrogenase, partial [Streptosporangiaceae bacterium]